MRSDLRLLLNPSQQKAQPDRQGWRNYTFLDVLLEATQREIRVHFTGHKLTALHFSRAFLNRMELMRLPRESGPSRLTVRFQEPPVWSPGDDTYLYVIKERRFLGVASRHPFIVDDELVLTFEDCFEQHATKDIVYVSLNRELLSRLNYGELQHVEKPKRRKGRGRPTNPGVNRGSPGQAGHVRRLGTES